MIAIALTFLLSTFLMYGSRGGSGRGAVNEDGTMQDYVVATVGGKRLMRSQLDTILRNYLQQTDTSSMTSEDLPRLYQSALESFVFQTELEKEVNRLNIQVAPEEVEARIKMMADQYPTREAFYQYIERSGVKMDALRKDVAAQIRADRTLTQAIGNVVVSEDEVLDFYEKTKTFLFSKPAGARFDLAHLKTRDAAEKFRLEAENPGMSWDEVLSADPMPEDLLDKTVSSAPVFVADRTMSDDERFRPLISLDLNVPSPVIEVESDDYMVAVKRSVEEAGAIPFDEVSADLRAMMQQQEEQAAFSRYQQELVSRAQVVIEDHELFPAPVSEDLMPIVDAPETSGTASADAEETPAPVSADAPGAPVSSDN